MTRSIQSDSNNEISSSPESSDSLEYADHNMTTFPHSNSSNSYMNSNMYLYSGNTYSVDYHGGYTPNTANVVLNENVTPSFSADYMCRAGSTADSAMVGVAGLNENSDTDGEEVDKERNVLESETEDVTFLSQQL